MVGQYRDMDCVLQGHELRRRRDPVQQLQRLVALRARRCPRGLLDSELSHSQRGFPLVVYGRLALFWHLLTTRTWILARILIIHTPFDLRR